MKKTFFLFAVLFSGLIAVAQPSHPNSPHDTLSAKNLKVTYGRPYKKGRVIFGELEKYGEVWRCGADEATEITFLKDVSFAGKPVKAGTYTLFVIPNEKTWTIILNGDTKYWGTQYAQHKAKDVLHVDVPVTKLPATVEQLTIKSTATGLTIAWDQTQVSVPLSFK